MFAMVSRVTDEPRWPLSRAQDLQEMSHNPSATSDYFDGFISVGLELKIPGLRSRRRQPELKWVHWRWPRFEYDLRKSKLRISIQWMVRDHIVLQQWVIENKGEDDICVPIEFGRDMWIQDMEYVDYKNRFNDRSGEQGQFACAGPQGYGWVLLHPFDESMCKGSKSETPTLYSTCKIEDGKILPWSAKDSRHWTYKKERKSGDSDPQAATTTECAQHKEDKPIATAVMGVFVNGEAHQFKGEDPAVGQWEEILKRGTTMEITAAYKLILVPRKAVDYRNFLIPAAAANVSHFLADEPPLSPCSLSAIDLGEKHVGSRSDDHYGNDHLAPAYSTLRPKDTIGNEGARVQGTATLSPYGIQQQMLRPLGSPTTVSLRSHIDFAIWRNLEHILSVCAIPLQPPLLVEHQAQTGTGSETDAVALTCGDFSGHRLYNPASL